MNAMNGTNGAAVLDRVRQAMNAAREAGQPTPGRPTLVKLTGANDYQVRKALAALETAPGASRQPVTSQSPVSHQPGDEVAVEVASPSPAPASVGESPAITSHHQPSPANRQPIASPPAPSVASDPTSSPASHQPPARQRPANPPVRQPVTSQSPTVASDAGESPAHQPASRCQPRVWPLLVIGLAAAVAVWSGWVGLGKLAGFGVIQPLPGIWDDLHLDTAVVLPISVEAYAAYALRVWLSTDTRSARTVRFARFSTMASLVIGAGAQVAYHLMAAAGYTRAPWPVVTLVAVVPVVVLGLASALAKLVTSDSTRTGSDYDR
jgi:hypothetical protein